TYVLFLFARLVFELCHPLKFAHARHAVQQPRKFRVLGHIRLHKHCRNLRIDPDSKVDARKFACLVTENSGVLWDRNRVQIDDAEEAFVLVLERDPVAQGAKVIAEMNVAGGLRAAENSFHLTGTEKQNSYGKRHHKTEHGAKDPSEHGNDQQEEAKTLQCFKP